VNIRGESYRLKEKRAAAKETGVVQELGAVAAHSSTTRLNFFLVKGGKINASWQGEHRVDQ
jgi:hypothetical protein